MALQFHERKILPTRRSKWMISTKIVSWMLRYRHHFWIGHDCFPTFHHGPREQLSFQDRLDEIAITFAPRSIIRDFPAIILPWDPLQDRHASVLNIPRDSLLYFLDMEMAQLDNPNPDNGSR